MIIDRENLVRAGAFRGAHRGIHFLRVEDARFLILDRPAHDLFPGRHTRYTLHIAPDHDSHEISFQNESPGDESYGGVLRTSAATRPYARPYQNTRRFLISSRAVRSIRRAARAYAIRPYSNCLVRK